MLPSKELPLGRDNRLVRSRCCSRGRRLRGGGEVLLVPLVQSCAEALSKSSQKFGGAAPTAGEILKCAASMRFIIGSQFACRLLHEQGKEEELQQHRLDTGIKQVEHPDVLQKYSAAWDFRGQRDPRRVPGEVSEHR